MYHQKRVQKQFRERLAKHKRETVKTLSKLDAEGYDDPHVIAEFCEAIYKNMRDEEDQNLVDPSYLTKVQTEIKDTSRAFLLEWIIDVHRKFRLVPEALYVT